MYGEGVRAGKPGDKHVNEAYSVGAERITKFGGCTAALRKIINNLDETAKHNVHERHCNSGAYGPEKRNSKQNIV